MEAGGERGRYVAGLHFDDVSVGDEIFLQLRTPGEDDPQRMPWFLLSVVSQLTRDAEGKIHPPRVLVSQYSSRAEADDQRFTAYSEGSAVLVGSQAYDVAIDPTPKQPRVFIPWLLQTEAHPRLVLGDERIRKLGDLIITQIFYRPAQPEHQAAS